MKKLRTSPFWFILLLLLALLALLQYRLWLGEDGSISNNRKLQHQIDEQRAKNEQLLERNFVLEAEVVELKRGLETVEERARQELGMIKDGETLYLMAK